MICEQARRCAGDVQREPALLHRDRLQRARCVSSSMPIEYNHAVFGAIVNRLKVATEALRWIIGLYSLIAMSGKRKSDTPKVAISMSAWQRNGPARSKHPSMSLLTISEMSMSDQAKNAYVYAVQL